MDDAMYQAVLEIVETLKAVTRELHQQHASDEATDSMRACRKPSCQTMSGLEARVELLRRSLGLSAFRPGGR